MILLILSIYVTFVRQVDYVVNTFQFSVDTLQFQKQNIVLCCREDYSVETKMKQLAIITFYCGFSTILVSCHFYFSTLEKRFIWVKITCSDSLNFLGRYSDSKGNEPVALFGHLKIMETKDIHDGWLKEDDIWKERLLKLQDFGNVNNLNGDFIFTSCNLCNGPLIAHKTITDQESCERIKSRAQKLSKVEVANVESWIKEMPTFRVQLAEVDKRYRACFCDGCDKTYKNRAAYENHLVTVHKMSVEHNGLRAVNQDSTLMNILSNQNTLMEKFFNKPVEAPKTAQLVKPKLPPHWIGQSFEVYEKEVTEWSAVNPEDEFDKYGKIIEHLKKNTDIKGLKEYITDILMPIADCQSRSELTVKFILNNLKVRFGKSKIERLQDVLKNILNFSVKSSETSIEYFDRFNRLMTIVEKEKVENHFQFLLGILMVNKAYEGALISMDEKTRLFDVIQTGDSPLERVPIEENLVSQKLKNEFYRLKIECVSMDKNATNTYFANGRSRYDNWRSFKNSSDFNKFKRSDSRPGYWRSNSQYVREPSRSRSRPRFESRPLSQQGRNIKQRSYSRSQSRSEPNKMYDEMESLKKKQESLEKKTDEILKANSDILKMLEKFDKKSNNVRIVEAVQDHDDKIDVSSDVMNVMYAKDVKETDIMIVDTGCPKSLSGESWIETYLKENNLKKSELEVSKCSQHFRFGPGQVYHSDEIIVLPVSFRASESKVLANELVYTRIEVYIVKDATVPLLCGRNTLNQWGAILDIKRKYLILESKGGKKVCLEQTNQDHLVVKMFKVGQWSTSEAVYFIKDEADEVSLKQIKKIHENLAHKSEDQMLHAYRNAGKLSKKVRDFIKIVTSRCQVCKKYKKSFPKPKVTLPKVTDFNQIVSLDLKQFDKKYVLWCVCSFTRFIQGVVIPDKSAKTIVEGLNETWNWRFGFPSVGFWADNGLEFQNAEMHEYASKFGFSVKFGPTYSPWSNGINERNHASADNVVKKMISDNKLSLKSAVSLASWAHNTNVNVLGYDPMSLVTGKSVTYPGVTTGNLATDCAFTSENIQRIMEGHKQVTELFRKDEYSAKLKLAEKARTRQYQNIVYQTGDTVFYQDKDSKTWLGPVKVQNQDGPNVWIYVNGDLKKVASCKVQPHNVQGVIDNSLSDEEEYSVSAGEAEKLDSLDDLQKSDEAPRVRTRSETRSLKDKENDVVGAYYLKAESTECFDDTQTTYVVEVPVKEHSKPEVIEAKLREVQNLKDYCTFEEVSDEGQERVGSRWVITKKEKHDGQKTQFKARLVAKGFHEKMKPQADSPTALRESFKLFCSVAANEQFGIQSIDIRAAFLQSKELDRDVYLEPPKDLRTLGIIWKLRKPLYGLDDASRKFWIRVKEIFHAEGLQKVTGDEAFYFKYHNGSLIGMILTHVDDFSMAGTKQFLLDITKAIQANLTVSKVEMDSFRFTGIDVTKLKDTIEISMNDYADSIEYIDSFRNGKPDDKLSDIELKLYRKYTGKLSWLAANTRPDLAVVALQMSIKGKDATLKDLKRINHIVAWVKEKESKLVFSHIGSRDELRVVGIGDASYHMDRKSIGGSLVLLGNIRNHAAVPIYWKSKTIQKVCHSAKAAETRNLIICKDDSQFFAGQVAQLVYGDLSRKIPIKIFTDSIPLLESIGSTKQIEEKMLRNSITDFKEDIEQGCVESYSWLETREMLADVLTKECRKNIRLEEVLLKNSFSRIQNEDYKVILGDGELKLVNKSSQADDGRPSSI